MSKGKFEAGEDAMMIGNHRAFIARIDELSSVGTKMARGRAECEHVVDPLLGVVHRGGTMARLPNGGREIQPVVCVRGEHVLRRCCIQIPRGANERGICYGAERPLG